MSSSTASTGVSRPKHGEVENSLLDRDGEKLADLVAQGRAQLAWAHLRYFDLADHGPLTAHAKHDRTPLKPALGPQALDGGGHGGRVAYLALDHGPGREANLGKLHDLPVATMADDLCRSYC